MDKALLNLFAYDQLETLRAERLRWKEQNKRLALEGVIAMCATLVMIIMASLVTHP
jgi:hypothetical protein